jgi:hypothetical protein
MGTLAGRSTGSGTWRIEVWSPQLPFSPMIWYYDGKFPKKPVIHSVTDNIRVTFASMIQS